MFQKRFNISQVHPAAYTAMNELEKLNRKSSVSLKQRLLIKIRASIINGCAYCIDMHTREAKKMGESEHRLYALSAWQESPLFTDEERAMLAFTDEATQISKHGVSDEVYNNLLAHFSEKQTAEMLMVIVAINGWNRMAITVHSVFEPEEKSHGEVHASGN